MKPKSTKDLDKVSEKISLRDSAIETPILPFAEWSDAVIRMENWKGPGNVCTIYYIYNPN